MTTESPDPREMLKGIGINKEGAVALGTAVLLPIGSSDILCVQIETIGGHILRYCPECCLNRERVAYAG
jgi:hypothetical protein